MASLFNVLNGIESANRTIDSIIHPQTPAVPETAALSGAPISLGDFDFDEFDAPQSIDSGVTQAVSIHTLMGGRRVVDAHGAEEHPIRWSGKLFGPDSPERARQLKQMARDAKRRTLCWGEEDYDVLVGDVRVNQSRPFLFDYDIEVMVLETRRVGAGSTPSLSQLIKADIDAAAISLPTGVGASGLKATLSSVKSAVATVTQTAHAASQLIGTVQQVRDTVKGQLANANNAIRAIGSIGGLGSTTNAIKSLGDAKRAFQDVELLGNSSASLGRTINRLTDLKFG